MFVQKTSKKQKKMVGKYKIIENDIPCDAQQGCRSGEKGYREMYYCVTHGRPQGQKKTRHAHGYFVWNKIIFCWAKFVEGVQLDQ
jgi:hypothetical protein